MTDIYKGDLVLHTVFAKSSEHTTEYRIRHDGWSCDVVEEWIEVVERADDAANDPIGTVRRMPADEDSPEYPVVKVARNCWVDLDGIEQDAKDTWQDASMVGKPKIGAVPESPAMEGE